MPPNFLFSAVIFYSTLNNIVSLFFSKLTHLCYYMCFCHLSIRTLETYFSVFNQIKIRLGSIQLLRLHLGEGERGVHQNVNICKQGRAGVMLMQRFAYNFY